MSYEYLKKSSVIPWTLCKQIDRIGKRVVQLNQKDEERAARLHRESIVIDLHTHLRVRTEDPKNGEMYSRSGRVALGYEGLKQSGMTACLKGFGGSIARRSSPVPWQFDDMIWDLGMKQADLDHHQDVVVRGYSVKDILEAKKTGKTAIIPNIENAGVIYNEIDRLDVLYGLGIRCLGLSYNERNTIADGATEETDCGLSKFGYKVVERMNNLGMLIDLSHSSDLTSKQAIEASEVPCCFSHTMARSIHDNPKGKPDWLIELLVKKGGVIGIEAVPNITSNKAIQTVFDVIDHIDYIVNLVGVDYVAIGTDAAFGDHVASHKTNREFMGLTEMVKAFNAPYMEYIENPSEFPNITRALVARGYSDDDIKKIIGGNVLRMLRQTIG